MRDCVVGDLTADRILGGNAENRVRRPGSGDGVVVDNRVAVLERQNARSRKVRARVTDGADVVMLDRAGRVRNLDAVLRLVGRRAVANHDVVMDVDAGVGDGDSGLLEVGDSRVLDDNGVQRRRFRRCRLFGSTGDGFVFDT